MMKAKANYEVECRILGEFVDYPTDGKTPLPTRTGAKAHRLRGKKGLSPKDRWLGSIQRNTTPLANSQRLRVALNGHVEVHCSPKNDQPDKPGGVVQGQELDASGVEFLMIYSASKRGKKMARIPWQDISAMDFYWGEAR